MELTITKITRNQRTSVKTGKPFTSVGIQTIEYASRWLSGFGSQVNAGWNEGDKISVEVTESAKLDKEGRPYLNFTMPQRPQGSTGLTEAQANQLTGIQLDISQIKSALASILVLLQTKPEDVVDVEDMPFPLTEEDEQNVQ